MKLVFRRSGGIAGRVDGCELDSEGLSPEEAAELRHLVEQSGFSESFERFSEHARDALVYTIDLENERGAVRVAFDETSASREVEPLLEFLQERSSWRRPA